MTRLPSWTTSTYRSIQCSALIMHCVKCCTKIDYNERLWSALKETWAIARESRTCSTILKICGQMISGAILLNTKEAISRIGQYVPWPFALGPLVYRFYACECIGSISMRNFSSIPCLSLQMVLAWQQCILFPRSKYSDPCGHYTRLHLHVYKRLKVDKRHR